MPLSSSLLPNLGPDCGFVWSWCNLEHTPVCNALLVDIRPPRSHWSAAQSSHVSPPLPPQYLLCKSWKSSFTGSTQTKDSTQPKEILCYQFKAALRSLCIIGDFNTAAHRFWYWSVSMIQNSLYSTERFPLTSVVFEQVPCEYGWQDWSINFYISSHE